MPWGFFSFSDRYVFSGATMRNLYAVFLCLAFLLAAPVHAAPVHAAPVAAAPISIETLLEPGGILSASLSPDGKHIAVIGFTGLNYGLILVEADDMTSTVLITGRKEVELNYIYDKSPRRTFWITNDLIAVDYGYKLESVDLKGKRIADLGERLLGKADPEDANSVMVLAYTDAEDGDVALIDARTGKKTRYRVPMSGRQIASAFDSKGNLRAVTMMDAAFWKDVTLVSNWYRAGPDAEWVKLAEFRVSEDFWTPIAVPDEDNRLIIRSRLGRDTAAIFSYDTVQRKTVDMLAGHPTLDIMHAEGVRDALFRNVVTNGMIPKTEWFDPAWAQMQASVDAALPGRVNLLAGKVAGRILVHSYSDLDPGSWYLLDVAAMKMRPLGRTRDAIDPDLMRPMETVTYPAPDGVQIPAYLTRPAKAAGPGPAVVMIHGGPTYRDEWGWNEDVQFLASRGYTVIQPQFRGSTGFGRKFELAGDGQWGRAMQDDVTAAVTWMVKQGIADPKRICIYGASYGGYAALWGLARDPDLYQCGISFAGVTDIENMLNDSSDSNANKEARQLLRVKVGDAKLDKAQFDQVSPLKQAGRIKAPVLLMHGKDDKRVTFSHARKMKRALEEQKKSVEFVEFPDAGHGLRLISDKTLYFEKIEGFLARYIGPPAAPPDTNKE
jgi:dienelactone hydrolase